MIAGDFEDQGNDKEKDQFLKEQLGIDLSKLNKEITFEAETLTEELLDPDFEGDLSNSRHELLFFLIEMQKSKLPNGVKNELLEIIELSTPEEIGTLVDKLLQDQNEDGSWQSEPEINYLPDQLLSTLITVEMLYLYYVLPSEGQLNSPFIAYSNQDRTQKVTTALEMAGIFISQNISKSVTSVEPTKPLAYEALLFGFFQEVEGFSNISGIKTPIYAPVELLKIINTQIRQKMREKFNSYGKEPGTFLSILEAMEAFGDNSPLKATLLRGFRSGGSMGSYPSSTLYWFRKFRDELGERLFEPLEDSHSIQEAVRITARISNVDLYVYWRGYSYIKQALEHQRGLPPFYPSDYFDKFWSILALMDSPLKKQVLPFVVEDISKNDKHWAWGMPVGINPVFSLKDVDTSSVKSLILNLCELAEDSPKIVTGFYSVMTDRSSAFYCYAGENRTSPSAIFHSIDAIVRYFEQCEDPISEDLQKKIELVLNFQLNSIHESRKEKDITAWYKDKWQISPLYPTCLGIQVYSRLLSSRFPLDPTQKELVKINLIRMLNYVTNSYLENNLGGGFSSVTHSPRIEETSYAVKSIITLQEHYPDLITETHVYMLRNAFRFLAENKYDREEEKIPGLTPAIQLGQYVQEWIAKSAYAPAKIIQAERLGALASLIKFFRYQ